MATIQIFNEEASANSTVTVDLKTTMLADPLEDMVVKSYLTISTNIKDVNGSSYPIFVIQDLSDIAPGASAATTFTELIDGYIAYFIGDAELGQSSSSSSSSTSSEGYSESSSSSGGYSESSSSGGYSESSSSSEDYSESSSSSEDYSESSSSEGYSESSSSEGNSESSSSEGNSESSSSSGV